jgi:oligoendopeptidase F
MKKSSKKSKGPLWNLALLYKSADDPQIEKDMAELGSLFKAFADKYDTADKRYLHDEDELSRALTDFEKMSAKFDAKPLLYFHFLRDIEASNEEASAKTALFSNRIAKYDNMIAFFMVSLGTIPQDRQKQLISSVKLAHFKVFLSRVFSDAQHMLSIAEEKIMNLKSQPAYEMWISGNEKMLNMKSVPWKGKGIPLAEALNAVRQLSRAADRAKLAGAIAEALKTVAPLSEAEINAVVIDKKINDELRGFKKPYESTIRRYRNDPKVVERLVDTVTGDFHISHRFYKLKAKLLKLKQLGYQDRAAKIGKIKIEFPFTKSVSVFSDILMKLDPKLADIFKSYVSKGQIDAPPRIGKRGGAYCAGTYENPTFVLLNHTDDLHSFTTLAHEMGHAFHGELSRLQGPIYSDYSTALAETASTLFESIALDEIIERLPDKEKAIVLHDKINDDIATIFRQVACFNFEKEIHETVRTKGFMSKEELAELHNKHMKAYLGPVFKMKTDDGYYFVHWSHLRRFFYVYSYAYGMLVSKALLRRYRADRSFWRSIERFLSAGGKASPEEILLEIGIDVSKPGFFEEGLKEIEEDIVRLEKLTGKK